MKNLSLLCLLTWSVALAGCGGSSSGGSDRSPFAGTYNGTFVSEATDNDDNGTLAITVASDGTISGTATDSRYGNNGVIGTTSQVHRDGSVVLQISFPSGGGGVSTTYQGTIAGNAQTTLTGTLNEKQGDIDVPFTFTLNRTN